MDELEMASFYGDYSSLLEKFKLEVMNDFWYNIGTDKNSNKDLNAKLTSVDKN